MMAKDVGALKALELYPPDIPLEIGSFRRGTFFAEKSGGNLAGFSSGSDCSCECDRLDWGPVNGGNSCLHLKNSSYLAAIWQRAAATWREASADARNVAWLAS